MSRHRQSLQVGRRSQGLELRGDLGNGGLNDYRNARLGGGGYGEGFGIGSRGRIEDQGRAIGRLGGRLGNLDLGGRFGGVRSMGGEIMGNPGTYERQFGYGLQSPTQIARGPLGECLMGRQQDPYLARKRFDYGMGDPRDLRAQRQGELGPMLLGRQQGLASPDSRRPSLQSLRDGSQYGLNHFDRQPRLYHYRPPYAEDDLTEEEYLRRQEFMDMDQMGTHPDDYYGRFFEDEDLESLQRTMRR